MVVPNPLDGEVIGKMLQSDCDDDPDMRPLLATSIYGPTTAHLDELCARYHSESTWLLFGYRLGQQLVGCVGIRVTSPDCAVIQHIAVRHTVQRRGVGRHMIDQLQHLHQYRCLEAETDHDAVGFYRRCGFSVESLGERYPGTERFRCRIGAA